MWGSSFAKPLAPRPDGGLATGHRHTSCPDFQTNKHLNLGHTRSTAAAIHTPGLKLCHYPRFPRCCWLLTPHNRGVRTTDKDPQPRGKP